MTENQNFTPQPKTIQQIFSTGLISYELPEYQRDYCWKDEQVNQLWEDLNRAFKNKDNYSNYFLGSIILVKKNDNLFEIVDGQQRITTLMILFCLLEKLYPQINAGKPSAVKSKQIKGYIMPDDDDDNPRLRYYPGSANAMNFKDYVINQTAEGFKGYKKPDAKKLSKSDCPPEILYQNTAYILREFLQSLNIDEIGEFINFIAFNVNIIEITCDNINMAVKLFEVINSRGLDLTTADIVKAKLMPKKQPNAKDNIDYDRKKDEFKKYWQDIYGIIKGVDLEMNELISIFVYSRSNQSPTKSILDSFEELFRKNNAEYNISIIDIKKCAEFIDAIENSENKNIYLLQYLRWKLHWRAVLVCALNNGFLINGQDFIKLTKYLVKFYYLHWIAGKTLDSIRSSSFEIISLIQKQKENSLQNIKDYIDSKFTNGILKAIGNNLSGDVYEQPWVKPIFALLEYQTDESVYIKLDSKIHLDHIHLQNPNENDVIKEINQNPDKLHCFGNLALLNASKNILAQNKLLADKKSIYKGEGRHSGASRFQFTRDVAEYDKWELTEVNSRQIEILKIMQNYLDFNTQIE